MLCSVATISIIVARKESKYLQYQNSEMKSMVHRILTADRHFLCFPHAIRAVRKMLKKFLVLQIDDYGVRFKEALFRHVAHDVLRAHRALFFQNLRDDLARDTRLIATFPKAIHATAHQHEALSLISSLCTVGPSAFWPSPNFTSLMRRAIVSK